METIKLYKGRFINETDIKERRKVIVLHKKTAEILFNKTHTEPIGQFVNMGNVAYQVVGLCNDKGDSGENPALIPFSTLQIIYNKGDKLSCLTIATKNLETIEANENFEKEYRKALGANHRFDPTDHSAIWIWNRFTNYLQQQKGMAILRTGIWVIGIFTLLSGIVGVSNIMLITVKERTTEIGIRRAIGARPRDIMQQILSESMVLTTIAGMCGISFAVMILQLLEMGVNSDGGDTHFQVSFGLAIGTCALLIALGMLAGLAPAYRAMAIKPIEAIRDE